MTAKYQPFERIWWEHRIQLPHKNLADFTCTLSYAESDTSSRSKPPFARHRLASREPGQTLTARTS